MQPVIGIDSRPFNRVIQKRDGTIGHFNSVVGVAVQVKDYEIFDKEYRKIIEKVFSNLGIENKYSCYCFNDIKNEPLRWKLLDSFAKEISKHVDKVTVIYTLFSPKRLPKVKVYGRKAAFQRIKMSEPTRSYLQLIDEHLTNTFPGICAWRIMRYFNPRQIQFHLDSYGGHIFEAQEELESSSITQFVFNSGDCVNSIISTADLLIALLDERLSQGKKRLIFENLRPALPEFGEKVLACPILGRDLRKITPVDTIPIDNSNKLKHPIYWIFKEDDLIDSGVLKRSDTYRNLLDIISVHGGCAKLFEKKDNEKIKQGDYGVYFNDKGLQTIKTLAKIGKRLIPLNIDLTVVNA